MTNFQLKTKTIQKWEDCETFAQMDVFSFLVQEKKEGIGILVIDHFEIEKESRGKGLGKSILKEFCEKNKEKAVILLVAGVVIEEEAEEPTEEEYQEKLDALERFYASVGFVNVNDQIGQYQNKRTFLYNAGTGEDLIYRCIKNERR